MQWRKFDGTFRSSSHWFARERRVHEEDAMLSKASAGRRFAYGLAAFAVAGMTLSTPAEAQARRGGANSDMPPSTVIDGQTTAQRGGYGAATGYQVYPVRYRGYAYGYPGYHAYPGYAYAYPGYGYLGYAYGYPAYGYPYGYYYRKKRSNRAAIAAAVIGGMALGAILSSQARHPRKAYYYRHRRY
jgi:hypothetical protein